MVPFIISYFLYYFSFFYFSFFSYFFSHHTRILIYLHLLLFFSTFRLLQNHPLFLSSSLAIFLSVRTKLSLFPINSKPRSPLFYLLSHRHRMIGLRSSGVHADRFLPLFIFIFLSNTLSILINYYTN